jgi:GH24 family phage-related lysozyme (muramidase)
MNLKRIIREEIKSLPSFGNQVCMVLHKSGEYFLSKHVHPYVLTSNEIRDSLENPHYYPGLPSMYGECNKMNKFLNDLKIKNFTNPKFVDESVLDLDFNINDFEVVPYYNGLIPYTGNIFESQDDFDWIKDTNKWSYISDVVNQGISEFKGETLEYKMWFGELSYENHRDLRNFIKQNGWLPFPSADGVIIDSIYIDIRGTEPDGISFSYMGCSKTRDCEKVGGEYSISARKKQYDREFFDTHHSIAILDDHDINECEYHLNGLIPYTGNIFESQDDFGWIRDANIWSYISDVVNQGIREFKGETLEYKMWLGELSYEDHKDLRNLIMRNGWHPIADEDEIIVDSIYIDIYGTKPNSVFFSWMGCDKYYDCGEIDGKFFIPKDIKKNNREYFDRNHSITILDDHDINECEYHLNRIVKRLSILTEDGKLEPDMEWDFTKKELDKSKQWVQTKEDVKEYLKLLFQKVKDLPKTTKIKILKYVLVSFIGLVSLKELSTITNQVSPEKIDLALSGQINQEKTQIKIRKSSPELLNHLKWEEGSIREKGKPVLTAYDLGDGAYTIGYGHAVFKDPSRGDNGGKYDFLPKWEKIKPGKTKISPKQAEILLKDDIKIAEVGLNKILNDWENQGINPQINQKMYDSMISMIFNMGIGNFRKSEFIQMVKRGDFDSASQEIKNISSHMFRKYPGLKVRREKESELFSS